MGVSGPTLRDVWPTEDARTWGKSGLVPASIRFRSICAGWKPKSVIHQDTSQLSRFRLTCPIPWRRRRPLYTLLYRSLDGARDHDRECRMSGLGRRTDHAR